MARFLAASLVAGAVLTAGLWALVARGAGWIGGPTAVLAGVTATVAGAAGWSIVLLGLSRRPEATMGFFAAGTAAKLLGLAIATAVVAGFGLAPMDEFVLATLGVFLALGLVQMGLVAREAARRGAPGGAPGTDRGKRETPER